MKPGNKESVARAQRVARAAVRIAGAGGGPSAPYTPVEKNDTLFSAQVGRVLDLISEGPIWGLLTGDGRSIYLNDTPIYPETYDDTLDEDDPNNQPNFKQVGIAFRKGEPDQVPIPDFAETETPIVVGIQVRKAKDHDPIPSVRSSSTPGLDAIVINLRTGPLYETKDNGDIGGTTLQYRIFYRLNGEPEWMNVIDASRANAPTPPPGQSNIWIPPDDWILVFGGNPNPVPIVIPPPSDNPDFPRFSNYFDIRGKARNGYGKSHRITLPVGTTSYDIKIEKITDDPRNSKKGNTLYWDSIIEVIDSKFSYPHRAIAGVKVNAEHFQSIPTRAYLCRGIIVSVPSNRDNDPDSPNYRQYIGDWDGTFVQAYTDNPAWLMYATLTNERWGLGQFFPTDSIDRWSLYAIGRYCDEWVDDGSGGTEPRFALNAYIQTQQGAYNFVQQLAAVFRGIAYWSAGIVSFAQDRLSDPVHQFTAANVIDGQFSYTGSARRSRYTIALVRWNDPDDLYRPAVEYVEDQAGLLRYGPQQIEVTAFGATTKGQAIRVGRWILLTNASETEAISFQTGLEGLRVLPGHLFNVVDPRRGAQRYAGRIVSVESTQHFTLDREIIVPGGVAASIQVQMPAQSERITAARNATSITLAYDPAAIDITQIRVWADVDDDGEIDLSLGNDVEVQIVRYDVGSKQLNIVPVGVDSEPILYRVDYVMAYASRQLNVPGDVPIRQVEINSTLPDTPPLNAIWMLSLLNAAPTTWRCAAIRDLGGNVYEIAGSAYNEGKYAQVESGFEIPEPPDGFPTNNFIVTPPGVISYEIAFVVAPNGTQAVLHLSWVPSSSPNAIGYDVRWRRDAGNWVRIPRSPGAEAVIEGALRGVYDIEVTAIGSGGSSSSSTARFNIADVTPISQTRVTGLEIQGQGGRRQFTGRDPRFAWRVNLPDLAEDIGSEANGAEAVTIPPWFDGYVIEIWDDSTGVDRLRRSERVWDTTWSYTYAMNQEDEQRLDGASSVPAREFEVWVTAIDTFGQRSPGTRIRVDNPKSNIPTMIPTKSILGISWKWAIPSDRDFAGVQLYRSLDYDVPTTPENLIADGKTNPILVSAPPGVEYFYKWGAYDDFSLQPEEFSAVVSVTGDLLNSEDVGGGVLLDYVFADGGGFAFAVPWQGLVATLDTLAITVPAGFFIRLRCSIVIAANANFGTNTQKYDIAVRETTSAPDVTVWSGTNLIVDRASGSNGSKDLVVSLTSRYPRRTLALTTQNCVFEIKITRENTSKSDEVDCMYLFFEAEIMSEPPA